MESRSLFASFGDAAHRFVGFQPYADHDLGKLGTKDGSTLTLHKIKNLKTKFQSPGRIAKHGEGRLDTVHLGIRKCLTFLTGFYR